MGILETKKIVLLNYPLGLFLLKYKNVWVFWNKKKSGSNMCSPLNSSIDVLLFYIYNFYFEILIYKWINQFENQQESDSIF